MTEPTSLSMNQSSTNIDVDSSNVDSPKQQTAGLSLLDIPCFTPQVPETSTESSLCVPNQIEKEPTFEYEFSVCPSGGTPLFVTLWDKDDLSAAQRACCCNLEREQITYSETGNAFFKVRDEDWCFRKEPFQHSWTRNKIESVKPKSSPITADAILATL
jgi:hypothetical protein